MTCMTDPRQNSSETARDYIEARPVSMITQAMHLPWAGPDWDKAKMHAHYTNPRRGGKGGKPFHFITLPLVDIAAYLAVVSNASSARNKQANLVYSALAFPVTQVCQMAYGYFCCYPFSVCRLLRSTTSDVPMI